MPGLMGGEGFVDSVVGDSRANFFRPTLDHDSDGDVYASRWSHIDNMIFLWAFGPEIEDAMGRWRYLVF